MLGACGQVQREATLTTPSGSERVAGPGDVVLDMKITKSLPNAFGKADLFGRTTDAGRVTIQYMGSDDGVSAKFQRITLLVETNETTMSRTPLIIPKTSTTSVNGTVGGSPFTATGTRTEYEVIGPRPAQGYAQSLPPINFTLRSGESISIEGRNITLLNVSKTNVVYRVN